MAAHKVLVEFTVNAEQGPDQSSEQAAEEAVRAALAEVCWLLHKPSTSVLLVHLSDFWVKGVT